MNEMIKRMPEMLNGEGLLERLGEYPGYTPAIREKSSTERLMALSDIYNIYIPSQMSVEIYHKLYLGVLRSLQKKEALQAAHQQTANGKGSRGRRYQGIIGGSDSFTILEPPGLGRVRQSFRLSV